MQPTGRLVMRWSRAYVPVGDDKTEEERGGGEGEEEEDNSQADSTMGSMYHP